MEFLARQKFRFDLGQSIFNIITLIFVLISAGDKISSLLKLETKYMVFILVPLVLFVVWLFGYFLDKKRFLAAYLKEYNKQNEKLEEICKNTLK